MVKFDFKQHSINQYKSTVIKMLYIHVHGTHTNYIILFDYLKVKKSTVSSVYDMPCTIRPNYFYNINLQNKGFPILQVTLSYFQTIYKCMNYISIEIVPKSIVICHRKYF